MSTTYYLVKTTPSIVEPLEICTFSSNLFTFKESSYYDWSINESQHYRMSTIQEWFEMLKTLTSTDLYTIINEYNVVVTFNDFIEMLSKYEYCMLYDKITNDDFLFRRS